MRLADIPELATLTTPEKILLVEELWDEIGSDVSHIPMPESHKRELDRRFDNYRKNPGRLLSLEDLRSRINSRKWDG